MPVRGHFSISWEGGNHRLAPNVTYHPTLGQYLVVWEYEYSATDHDIYARRVANNGALIGDEIAIATLSNFESHPAVTYNSQDDEYLVVWERREGNGEAAHFDIYGQRLDPPGDVQAAIADIRRLVYALRPPALAGKVVKALAVSPHDAGTVYAGTKPALLYVSRDGGETWAELDGFRRIPWRRLWFSPAEPPFTGYVQAIALSPANPNVIVVGIEAGAVVRSTDGGQTWSGHRKGALRDCHSLAFHARHGDWVYEAGGSGGGAAVSRDAGQTWRQPRAGLDRHYGWAVAADPARPEVWYVSAAPSFSFSRFAPPAHVDGQANAYIFRAAGGAPWQKLGGGLPQPLDHMAYALLTDPAAPGHVYAGLSNGDAWHSADHGETWRKLPFNLGGIHRTLIML